MNTTNTVLITNRLAAVLSFTRLILTALVFVHLCGTSLCAKVFVSFNGKFHITYPDDWTQADYRTVDYYLQQGSTSPEVFQYEALFTPHEGGHFADDAYLILTVDRVGELSEPQIDSLMKQLGGAFAGGLQNFPAGDLMTMESNTPIYHPENRTVSVITDITEQQETLKKNLLVMKFYEHGIANFYFYAPDSLFEQSKPIFAGIVASFSTENLEAATPKEELKVVDLEERREHGWSRTVWLLIALAIVVIAAGLMRKRRRKKGQTV